MGIESLVVMLAVGAFAGWLAGKIVSGYGFGLLGNIVVGIVGAVVAGFVFPALGFSIGGGGIASSIVYATIGAVILLVVLRLVKRA